jgi:hypothetical protein
VGKPVRFVEATSISWFFDRRPNSEPQGFLPDAVNASVLKNWTKSSAGSCGCKRQDDLFRQSNGSPRITRSMSQSPHPHSSSHAKIPRRLADSIVCPGLESEAIYYVDPQFSVYRRSGSRPLWSRASNQTFFRYAHSLLCVFGALRYDRASFSTTPRPCGGEPIR